MPTFTTDVTTPIGQVRLLIWDMDSTQPIFPDDLMIQALLNLEDQAVKLAAALALETIAGNMAMTLKVIKLLDLQTNGAQTATGLLAAAQRFRDTNQDDWAGFDFAQVTDDSLFVQREYLTKLVIQQNSEAF